MSGTASATPPPTSLGAKTLIRLYDAAPSPSRRNGTGPAIVGLAAATAPAGVAVRPAVRGDILGALRCAEGDRQAEEQIRLAFMDEPVSAAVATVDDGVVACCLFNVTTRGTLGPLLPRYRPLEGVGAPMVSMACLLMSHAGYWYALADRSKLEEWSVDLDGCCAPVPADPASLSARERDVPLPHADLFLALGEELVEGARRRRALPRPTVYVHRPPAAYRLGLIQWVRDQFGGGWASEVECAFDRRPATVFFATRDPHLTVRNAQGFMAYGITGQGSTGPIGLRATARGNFALGAVLLQSCLRELYLEGFRYAILGGISRRRAVLRALPGAWAIPGSYPSGFPVEETEEARRAARE